MYLLGALFWRVCRILFAFWMRWSVGTAQFSCCAEEMAFTVCCKACLLRSEVIEGCFVPCPERVVGVQQHRLVAAVPAHHPFGDDFSAGPGVPEGALHWALAIGFVRVDGVGVADARGLSCGRARVAGRLCRGFGFCSRTCGSRTGGSWAFGAPVLWWSGEASPFGGTTDADLHAKTGVRGHPLARGNRSCRGSMRSSGGDHPIAWGSHCPWPWPWSLAEGSSPWLEEPLCRDCFIADSGRIIPLVWGTTLEVSSAPLGYWDHPLVGGTASVGRGVCAWLRDHPLALGNHRTACHYDTCGPGSSPCSWEPRTSGRSAC